MKVHVFLASIAVVVVLVYLVSQCNNQGHEQDQMS